MWKHWLRVSLEIALISLKVIVLCGDWEICVQARGLTLVQMIVNTMCKWELSYNDNKIVPIFLI